MTAAAPDPAKVELVEYLVEWQKTCKVMGIPFTLADAVQFAVEGGWFDRLSARPQSTDLTAEAVYRAWHGTTEPWGGCADRERIERVLSLLAAPPAPAPSSDEGRDELAELLAAGIGRYALSLVDDEGYVSDEPAHAVDHAAHLATVLRAHGYGKRPTCTAAHLTPAFMAEVAEGIEYAARTPAEAAKLVRDYHIAFPEAFRADDGKRPTYTRQQVVELWHQRPPHAFIAFARALGVEVRD